ncbi:MAG: citrate/2-methylcitrate synthase [Clostridium sp.]|uniref:citrate/2-methylcitrate synthase n=1 Tax=Clostridium sp. TaxID=1506 RepID=UPI002671D1B6|nr:citrate/2-methylcitrate synthase [Clostridium sp.]MCI7030325.1 citrate/2-methylcitrate synthase [Clostridium sp.]MDD7683548.1 citrate/2-methylcitrate synthase [Clostridium sp.]MDY2579358.1 citrate/2-methylcitrate synthase [Clostridium sp.]
MVERNFSEITPEIKKLDKICENNSRIDPKLYSKYKVFRGLRDLEGKGVLTGLTEISEVYAKKEVDGKLIPCHGQLFYRGINIEDLVTGFIKEDRFGFEETAYLLLLGELPNKEQLEEFSEILASYRSLPTSFVRDIIMKAPSFDMMNTLARSVLTLYSYDENPNDISISNVLRQSLQLISIFPLLSVYGYQAYNHYHNEESLIIHTPNTTLSTAENILYMLRPDSKYSKLEARILDLALVLHAEHGGGNNSSFTTHVVSSSGTDTYSVIAAALGSLKGPKHGGANIKVMQMFKDMKENVHDWEDEEEIAMYLNALLNKEAFDKSGLIYGIGHAIYSVSDPRAKVFKAFVKKLSEEKGLTKEYNLYETVERLAPKVIAKNRKTYKGVSANIDFYSGFVYSMLGLPEELYTPIFAMARIVGWSAHRIEELINADKIIRPAYMNVLERRPYVEIDKRK